MKRILFVALLLSVSITCGATEYIFKKYSIDNGLNHEIVRGSLQDDAGYIWVATEGGLHRFDGFQFVLYNLSERNAETAISDFDIDSKGNIWIGTFGNGLIQLDPKTGHFRGFTTPQLSSNNISTVFVDSKDNIWIGTIEEGVNLLPAQSNTVSTISPDSNDGVAPRAITAFTEDNLGKIWIGTNKNGIFIYNAANQNWEHLKRNSNDNSITSNRIKSLYKDSSGNIWIGTADNGLNVIESATKNIKSYKNIKSNSFSLIDDRVLSITEDKSGKLLIGTDGGFSILDNGRFFNTKQTPSNPEGLSDNKVISVFQDRSGLVWLGTYRGLNLWNPKTELFNHTLPRISQDLDYNLAMDFAELSNQNILIATYGGGIVVQAPDLSLQNITTNNGLSDNRIMSIFVDRDNGVWAGTRAHGLMYKSSPNASWLNYQHDSQDPNSLISNGITDILQDSNGDIWVSSYAGGVSKKTGKQFINYTSDDNPQNSLSSQNIFQRIEDRDGYIWLASDNGINLIEDKNSTVTQFLPDPNNTDSLSSEICWNIYEDSKGNFWIATQGNGIEFWAYEYRVKREENFKNIGLDDGLPSNTIYALEEDRNGNIWFSSSKGIGKITPHNLQIETYDKSHGLQGYDFVLGAGFKDSKGKLYFGGTNGFNQFYPDQIKNNDSAPNVELIGITSVTEKLPLNSNLNNIIFDHNDYLVSFDYVALDFAAPEKNQYKYRLSGFDNDWIDVGNRRRATYTNLPAGDYQFQVKAANNDGVWSGPQINLPVVVKPAPWKTPLAYAIYVIIIGTAIIWFLRNQMQRLAFEEKQRKELEQQVAKRTLELAEQNQQLQKLNTDLALAYRTDALTGIKNRRFLETYLQESLPALVPFDADNPQYMLVLLLDIDNLKPINDAYGHAAGDATISHAATLLSELIPENYNLIRWGGDEFLLLGITANKEESTSLVSNLIGNINAEQFLYLDKPIALSCSAGFAHYPFDEENSKLISWDQVTMLADKAMNCAKSDSGCTWIGVTQAKREVNDLYVSDLMHCAKITEATELVELAKG
ncbi:MAG: two-component regulator propeller domain-containing protein [Aestuariibacter sp.]